MLTKPREPGLAPIDDETAVKIAQNVWMAICMMPRHRHNKSKAREDCSTCVANRYLIDAFKLFKRKGE